LPTAYKLKELPTQLFGAALSFRTGSTTNFYIKTMMVTYKLN